MIQALLYAESNAFKLFKARQFPKKHVDR